MIVDDCIVFSAMSMASALLGHAFDANTATF